MALTGIKKLKRRKLSPDDYKLFAKRIRREKNDRVAAISLCGFLDNCLQIQILLALKNEKVAWTLFDDRVCLKALEPKSL